MSEDELNFSSDFDEEYDYPDTHALHRNFDLASQTILSDDSDFDHDNPVPASPSRSESPTTTRPTARTTSTATNTAGTSGASAQPMDLDMDSDLESVDEPDNPVDNNYFANPAEHLQFIFEELDTENLPIFNWQKTENVMCTPAFTPDKPFGPTRAMPVNSKAIEYFNIFYDDTMLEKVGDYQILILLPTVLLLYYNYYYYYNNYIINNNIILFYIRII